MKTGCEVLFYNNSSWIVHLLPNNNATSGVEGENTMVIIASYRAAFLALILTCMLQLHGAVHTVFVPLLWLYTVLSMMYSLYQ